MLPILITSSCIVSKTKRESSPTLLPSFSPSVNVEEVSYLSCECRFDIYHNHLILNYMQIDQNKKIFAKF